MLSAGSLAAQQADPLDVAVTSALESDVVGRIGGHDPRLEYLFDGIRDVVIADSLIVVLDGGSGEVRAFTPRGELAGIPESVGGLLDLDEVDADGVDFTPPEPLSREEILACFEGGLESAHRRLDALTDERAGEPWRLTRGSAEIFTIPRIGLVRSLMFNHLYHHRGQLTVYLRLLDVPVPVTYGRSADESLVD